MSAGPGMDLSLASPKERVMNPPSGSRPWRPALRLLALALLAGGCSSSGTVTGKVTYKGEPLGSGKVAFYSANATATGDIDASGNYTIPKAPLGPVRVTVETIAPASGGGASGKN